MAKVTGIGGIFFKSENPEKLNGWYRENLAVDANGFGAKFDWKSDSANENGYTLWSPFAANTTYFEPSSKDFMINFIVDHIEELVSELQQKNIPLLDEIAVYEYGKFVHLMDPEGNKIELFEPAGQV